MQDKIIFITLPEVLEQFKNQMEQFKPNEENKENYDEQKASLAMTIVAFIVWVLFFMLWIYALWVLLSIVNIHRKREEGINALYVILLLFLLFYMPLFGMVVIYLLVYPELRKIKSIKY